MSDFKEIVKKALDLGVVERRELADEFHVAPATVACWAAGTTNPRPATKTEVVDHIRDLAYYKLEVVKEDELDRLAEEATEYLRLEEEEE